MSPHIILSDMFNDDIFSQKDILFLIFEKLDFKTICKCKVVNKHFKQVLDDVDRSIYETTIAEPFYQYKTIVYDFILTNVMYLTMNENANIYFEFLQNAYDQYGIVFTRECDFVSSSFSFMVLFYPFLENKTEYEALCKKLRRYLYINHNEMKTMESRLIKDHMNFKYNDLFTMDDVNNMCKKDIIELLCCNH
jgi:hypothetical protein